MTAFVVVDGANATFTLATETFVIGDSADSDGHGIIHLSDGDTVKVYTTELTLADLPNG